MCREKLENLQKKYDILTGGTFTVNEDVAKKLTEYWGSEKGQTIMHMYVERKRTDIFAYSLIHGPHKVGHARATSTGDPISSYMKIGDEEFVFMEPCTSPPSSGIKYNGFVPMTVLVNESG